MGIFHGLVEQETSKRPSRGFSGWRHQPHPHLHSQRRDHGGRGWPQQPSGRRGESRP